MAYIKNDWVDQNVERPRTYQLNENVDGSVTLIDDFGQVTELGTPVNADNMNHIEDGVAGIAIRLFNLDETFALNEWVKDGEKLYKSLQDQNQGHATSETDWWEEVSLGGAGMPVGTIIKSLANSAENGIYTNGTEFTDGQLPTFYTEWLESGLISTITYEQYQTELTMTGECWSVALDSVRRTFKVPFIKDEVVRNLSNTAPVKGNGKAIGYTNGVENFAITSGLDYSARYSTPMTNIYGKDVGTGGNRSYTTPDRATGLTTDGSKSGVVADLSNALKTKTIKHFLVVATGSIKQSEMDWSRYMDGLNGKANTDLLNVKANVDFVIEYKVNSDGSYYRKYKSGWLEQGGYTKRQNSNTTITFQKPFKQTPNITIGMLSKNGNNAWSSDAWGVWEASSTSFIVLGRNDERLGIGKWWYAVGQGA